MGRRLFAKTIGPVTFASCLLFGHDVVAERDLDGGSDAGHDTPTKNGCLLDVAGATYARMACIVRTAHHFRDLADGGTNPTPRIFLNGTSDSPAIRLWIQVVGAPKLGTQPNFVIEAFVEKSPAVWRAIAGWNYGTTGTADLKLTYVRKIRVDGGTSYELHGEFVATLKEITGVRGPDVVLSGRF